MRTQSESDDASRPEALHRVQEILLQLLRDVDRLCVAHDIEYWIDSGTLLGAVRHGGFIPWDDDIDLCMTRANLDKFVAVAAVDLAPDYTIATPNDDPALGVDAKILVNGTHHTNRDVQLLDLPQQLHDGLFADIFIADPMARTMPIRKIERGIAWLGKTRTWAPRMAKSRGLTRRVRLRWWCASIVPMFAVRYGQNWLDKRMRRRPQVLLGVGPAGSFNGVAYPSSTIFPLQRTLFADVLVYAPADPESYLTGMYGADYMTPPPPNERSHHITTVWFD